MGNNKIGKFLWHDLTVPNAEEVKDFYRQVVGWQSEDFNMGGYSDYNMKDPQGETVAGVCHRKGPNEKLPAQWLVYVGIEDLKTSLKHCEALGGKIIDGPKSMGEQQYAIIQDPAGAYMALFEE